MKAWRYLIALALVTSGGAGAQLAPAAQEVLLLAPQLQAFAGSAANFESLAGGLRVGFPVMLSTLAADGTREIVEFMPAQPLSAAETVRVMEGARQALLAQGIAAPSAWDIGVALMGGTLATASGAVKMPGLVASADPDKRLVFSVRSFAGSPANYKSLVAGLSQGRPVTLVTPGTRRDRLTFTPPGVPLSADETKQTLQLAAELLASQGIEDPTSEQLRAALIGGAVATPSGAKVLLRGVLEKGR